MPAILKNIAERNVPVLIGAATELVGRRQLVNKYQTNREIKVWAAYFILKSETASGVIKNWVAQKDYLQFLLKCNENTLRARLKDLKDLGLVTMLPGYSVQLAAYKTAAEVLEIDYQGTKPLKYDLTNSGNQHFQYVLRADEFNSNQEIQLEALHYKLNKNPSLAAQLHSALCQAGANGAKLLRNQSYYQQQLLKLQLTAFKEGSEIYTEVMSLRADINRGVRGITKSHGYKSTRSAVYLKRRMIDLGVVTVTRTEVISKVRSRLYVPGADGQKVDAYRWLPRKKETSLRLCDQLSFTHIVHQKKKSNVQKTAAA